MTVCFRCKACGGEHKSPIAFGDKKSFESSTLVDNKFRCPKIGRLDSYDKKDLFWKEEKKAN